MTEKPPLSRQIVVSLCIYGMLGIFGTLLSHQAHSQRRTAAPAESVAVSDTTVHRMVREDKPSGVSHAPRVLGAPFVSYSSHVLVERPGGE